MGELKHKWEISDQISPNTITHISLWDAQANKPRKYIGRSFIWLGNKLINLGTKKANIIATLDNNKWI